MKVFTLTWAWCLSLARLRHHAQVRVKTSIQMAGHSYNSTRQQPTSLKTARLQDYNLQAYEELEDRGMCNILHSLVAPGKQGPADI